MPIGGFLKASWDHLPKPPRLPPSLFSLKTRKAWLALQPTFTYGDERDKIQKENARRAKKQLARDEAWVKHEKKKQERLRKREQAKKERDAKRAERLKAKALASGSRSAPVTVKPKLKPTTTTKTRAMPTLKTRPVVAAVNPARAQQKPRVAPQVALGRSATVQRTRPPVVVTTQMKPATRRATAPVQPWGPIRTATHNSPVATKPRVTRAATYPAQPRRRS
ncbi:hypothetical protein FRB96_007614 [Tulasnella sp. 330]|nr:hypothetical protein FRB96_007614 [Tulasnella sp. 330]KAG8880067.1 hypothetical protein FRB97_001112 [Tulasnella sp. 331]KAG8886699.1 hypothetical protein FRB98_001103 [Tulasnella sp. 332]